jgi:hypothetical protein
MDALYEQWIKVDDIAIKAVELSLPHHDAEIVERIRLDYAQDIGLIGLLRRTHVEVNFEEAARLFWGSRREPTSPRLESLISQLLLNIAASAIFDILKELGRDPAQIANFIDARAIANDALQLGTFDLIAAWDHLLQIWQLHRWKQAGRIEPVRATISETLAGGTIRLEIEGATTTEVEVIRKNLLYAVRGLVIQEIERSGEVLLPANGRTIVGIPASAGIGFGTPVRWPAAARLEPGGKFILAVPPIGGRLPEALTDLISDCQAVVSTEKGLTGHVAVFCRSIAKPLVLVSQQQMTRLVKHGFLVVDGTAGRIKLFLDQLSSGL